MKNHIDTAGRLVADIEKLPADALDEFVRTLDRPTFRGPISGSEISTTVFGRTTDFDRGVRGCHSRNAALLLLAGGGRILAQTETIDMNARACLRSLNGHPALPDFRQAQGDLFVLVGLDSFVATVSDGKAVLLSSSFISQATPPQNGVRVVNADLRFVQEQRIQVTVHAFGLDGNTTGNVEYNWHCVVEVGFEQHLHPPQPG